MQNKDLISKLRQHDETGMAEFLQRYSPLMRYIIVPILSDLREQEECLSDVAMRVWDKIDQFDEAKGSFTSWLTVLTRNTALNRAKAGRNREVTQEMRVEIPSTEAGPEERMLRQERLASLKQALKGLKRSDEQLFYRKYYYLQSTAQIAAEMGMTERAVEGRLYRIKKKLRSELGGEWHE